MISKNPYQQSITDNELIFDKVVLINKETYGSVISSRIYQGIQVVMEVTTPTERQERGRERERERRGRQRGRERMRQTDRQTETYKERDNGREREIQVYSPIPETHTPHAPHYQISKKKTKDTKRIEVCLSP